MSQAGEQHGGPPRPSPVRMAGTTLRLLAALVFAGAIAVIGVFFDDQDVALVDTVDRFVGDYRFALLSPRAKEQRPEIAIVLITERTLLDYDSRSPLDRGLLAEIVRAVDAAGPKAIGLDVIFDRRTAKDADLIAAIKAAKAPVVLGSIDRRIRVEPENFRFQEEFLKLTGRPTGHFILERKANLGWKVDRTVREVGAPKADAFAAVLARAADYKYEPANRTIAWQLPPLDGTELFTEIEVPRHAPSTAKAEVDKLLRGGAREVLKNRVVIVGARMLGGDTHITPLSVVHGAGEHGVFVQAQLVAQRIDGNRDIKVWSYVVTIAIVAAVALFCFLFSRAVKFGPRSLYYETAGLLLIGLLSAGAFWLALIDIPSIALVTAWFAGGAGGHASEWAFRRLGIGA